MLVTTNYACILCMGATFEDIPYSYIKVFKQKF